MEITHIGAVALSVVNIKVVPAFFVFQVGKFGNYILTPLKDFTIYLNDVQLVLGVKQVFDNKLRTIC